jgi:hypothetical protein
MRSPATNTEYYRDIQAIKNDRLTLGQEKEQYKNAEVVREGKSDQKSLTRPLISQSP